MPGTLELGQVALRVRPCGSSPTRSHRPARDAAGTCAAAAARSRGTRSAAPCDRARPARVGRTSSSQNRWRWERAAEWNVRASTPSTPSPASRVFSSPAAFSVNVTARIWDAGNDVGGYLVRDPVRDGGGLAGSRAGQDGDRSAVRPGRLTLFLIQSLEDLLSVHTSNLAGKCDMSSSTPRVRHVSDGSRYPGRDDAAGNDRSAPRLRIPGPHGQGRVAREPAGQARARRRAVPRDRGVRRGGPAGAGARDPRGARPDPAGGARPGEDAAGPRDRQLT